jgi:hypothetical protein
MRRSLLDAFKALNHAHASPPPAVRAIKQPANNLQAERPYM